MEERKYIPISNEQLANLVGFAAFPPQLLNLSVRIDIDSAVDEERLLQALKLTVARLPYCNYRLHDADDNTVVQYLCTDSPEGMDEIIDFSSLTPEVVQKKLDKWAAEPFPNKARDVQLYRIRPIRLNGGKHCLFICVHHLIMDVSAITFTVLYLDKVYCALTNGTELPPESPLPDPVVEESISYLQSDKYQNELKWWNECFAEEPHFTSINGNKSKEFIKGKNYGHAQSILQFKGAKVTRRIPAELVKRVEAAALEKKISSQNYYFLALRTYLGEMSGTEDVIVNSLVSRRATLLQKRSGLTRGIAMFMRTIIPAECTFSSAIDKLNVYQRELYRHSNVQTAEMSRILSEKHGNPKGTKYYTVWFTYQPYIDFGATGMSVHTTFMDAGVAPAPLYLTIMPHDGTGDLYATYQCAVGYTPTQNAEKFHEFMLKFLDEGLSRPEATIAELFTEICG